jgi:hypothetical protein
MFTRFNVVNYPLFNVPLINTHTIQDSLDLKYQLSGNKDIINIQTNCYASYYSAHELIPTEIKLKRLKVGLLVSEVTIHVDKAINDKLFEKYCCLYQTAVHGPTIE